MSTGKVVSVLKKIMGDTPERAAEKLRGQLVPRVNRLEDSVRALTDEQLGAKTDEFCHHLDNGASLDNLLPEAFAVVREAARRTLGLRHHDVQLIGGAVLHQGKIAEIKDGEGKTLVATLPAYLNAITGGGVHIVTANDYLARRDPVWMGPIYHLLGLSVGCLQHDAAYLYDPELSDVSRDGFPYMTPVSRAEAYLADILYGASKEFGFDYLRDNMVVDAEMQVQTRAIYWMAVEAELQVQARDLVRPTHHFAIVDEADNILLDEAWTPLIINGPAPQRESAQIQDESITYATITLQNYFRMYRKLAGMTGTAATEADQFDKFYSLKVAAVPTNLPMVRDDASDLVLPTEEGKWHAVVEDIVQRSHSGQPVLVGTTSIEISQVLSDLLWDRRVQHRVLNARNHQQDASVVAQAGRAGAVTVVTNMTGRGTDIVLGGADTERKNWQDEHNRVIALGGLHVIGTERHTRRVDQQLRDRAGRHGAPGSSQFFVALDDELIQRFGDDRIRDLMDWSNLNDEPLENNLITEFITSAQMKAEGHHFDIRKRMLNFDDVLNQQRFVIYEQRSQILASEGLRERILDMLGDEFDRLVSDHLQARHADDWDADGFVAALRQICPPPVLDTAEKVLALRRSRIAAILDAYTATLYEAKERALGSENMQILARLLLLKAIDTHWVNHLTHMENLRTGVGLQAVGQRDPLTVYRSEGQRAFAVLARQMQREVTHTLFHVTLAPEMPDRG